MAKTKAQATAPELDEVDVDPTDLEEVEVSDDFDSWMAEMLAGPAEDNWEY